MSREFRVIRNHSYSEPPDGKLVLQQVQLSFGMSEWSDRVLAEMIIVPDFIRKKDGSVHILSWSMIPAANYKPRKDQS